MSVVMQEQKPELESTLDELVLSVGEMAEDEAIQIASTRFIGAVLADKCVEKPVVENQLSSLHEAINRAAEGDVEARELVRTNVATDVIERTIKTGMVMSKVKIDLNEDGKPMQFRQSLDSVHANSLRSMKDHHVMAERTKAETRNAFRIEKLSKEGYFDNDYSFVVFSRAENLPEFGFFTKTMSCAIQVTSKCGEGLATEPAFVSGIEEEAGKQHDGSTLVELYGLLGVDIESKTPAEIIDTPFLIHNSLIPNGVIDLVKLYDDCAGGTFFGESKPRQDYLEYKSQCELRELAFVPKIEKITTELISEADRIDSKAIATKRLHELSEKNMVEYAVIDPSIDPDVFGTVAAKHIENARHYFHIGDFESAQNETQEAKQTAISSSCPSGASSLEGGKSSMFSSEEDEFGSLSFKCPKGHSNTRKRKQLLTNCQKCGVSVKC